MEKGYCVKCKASQEMKNEEQVTLKNGRAAVKGKCTSCGTNMFKILGKKK
jgi:RNase P subunit RPR2